MSAQRRSGATSPAMRVGLGTASVTLAVLLLVGFKAPQDGVVMGAARNAGGTGTATGGNGTTTGGSGTSAGAGAATYDGPIVNTRYGLVQVEIAVTGGRVVAVTALELPVGGRSGMISNYVAPILSSEALSAQSASIDVVSGATYTSDAYAQSLQAALDQAGV